MKKTKTINEVIEQSFNALKNGTRVIKWKEFQVVDVEVKNTLIGIGVNHDFSTIKIFAIKKDAHYEQYDERKYKPTFKIGIPESAGCNIHWHLELDNDNKCLIADSQKIESIYAHFKATTEVLKFLVSSTHALSLLPN